MRFLRDVADAGPLQPLYGIGGERELVEELLDHLAGFEGAARCASATPPTRRSRHDLMGEMVLCLETHPHRSARRPRRLQPSCTLVERLVDEAIAKLSQVEDTGLWEYRTMPRHYTFSKVMCWVAAHRGAAARRASTARPSAPPHGRVGRRASGSASSPRAYNERARLSSRRRSTARYPDASNLLLPTLGIVDPTDPRFVSTVRAYEQHAGRQRPDAALPPRRRLRRDDQRVHDLLVLVGRGAGDDGRAGRGHRRSSIGCSVTRTRSASSPRTSSRRPAVCSATSRRPTRTSA